VPRRLENDPWLFGATLALCLLGAAMIFSASAVTAEQQYGHSYIFLARQAAWLFIGLLGMFALMKTDYRRLREPAVIYPVVCVVLLLLVGAHFFWTSLMPLIVGSGLDLRASSRRNWQNSRRFFIWRGSWIKSAVTNPAWNSAMKTSGGLFFLRLLPFWCMSR